MVIEPRFYSPRPALWPALAWVWALAWGAVAGLILFTVPFDASETPGNLLRYLSRPSALDVFLGTFSGEAWPQPGFLRTVSDATGQLVFDLAPDGVFTAFRTLHLGMLVALQVLLVRVARVDSPLMLGVVIVAGTALFGLHTFHESVRETELNIKLLVPVLCLGALALSAGRHHWWHDVAAVLLTFYAAFSNELGLLVWVCVAAAWLVGLRGVSRTGVLLSTALVVAYFLLRFVFWDIGSPSLIERSSGFGLRVLDPPELIARFGDAPLVLYVHNVAAAALTVLFTEPRSGAWVLVRQALEDTVSGARVLELAISLLTTGLMGWFVIRRWHDWRRRAFTYHDGLFLTGLAVIAGNAAISYPYLKEVTMSTGGVFYAVAMLAPLRLLLESLAQRVSLQRAVVTLIVVAALAAGWTLRGLSFVMDLTRTGIQYAAEWDSVIRASDFTPAELEYLAGIGDEMRAYHRPLIAEEPRWLERLDPEH